MNNDKSLLARCLAMAGTYNLLHRRIQLASVYRAIDLCDDIIATCHCLKWESSHFDQRNSLWQNAHNLLQPLGTDKSCLQHQQMTSFFCRCQV
jgi:hypothetical protein